MPPESIALALIPLLPLLGALANGMLALGFAHRQQGPADLPVAVLGCAFPSLACVLAAVLAYQVGLPGTGQPALESHFYAWIGSGALQIGADLSMDRLSAVMALIVTFVGSLIHLYSVGYMHGDRGFARYFAYLNLFLASMLVLVLARNLAVMFVGWEGVGLCSYLLIGFWYQNRDFAAAGSKAFIVNRIGDVGFVVGLCWLFWALNSPGAAPLDLPWLRTHVQDLTPMAAEGIALLLFLGAAGKSAQIPLAVWLPDAMAGPTPVSALIHAATMVTAGVYLVARMHFLYDMAPHAAELIAIVGTLTALWAALIATAQNDIKKVLAYSTISQLGYMFLAVGTGGYDAGVFHLFTHAFFKALLFLGAGALIHALNGEQDLLRMGGLARYFPLTHACFLAGTLAIAGIPPFAGFFSKDAILWHAWASDHPVLWGLGLVTAGLTSFYMFRLYFLAFQGAYRRPIEPEAHATPWTMGLPLVVLTAGALLAGWADTPRFLTALLPVPTEWLTHWMAPAIGASAGGEPAHSTQEWLLTGLALLAALVGLGLAAWRYRDYEPRKDRHPNWAYSLLQHKMYIDELYDLMLVRPLVWFSRTVLWKDFDTGIIDGTVNGLPRAYRGFSGAVRMLQTGHARLYALYVLLGLVGSLIYYTVRAMAGEADVREHLLTALIFVPLLGSLLFASLPAGAHRAARLTALLLALANLLLSLPLLGEAGAGYATGALVHNNDGFADFGFQENFPWIPGMGITYSLGVDGISMYLVLLVTGLSPLAVLSGWNSIRQRPRGFYACLTLVQAGMIGALCARDAFLFYIFWELMLLPMFFLIGIWGRTPARVYATIKFVIYTMAGSLFMLLAMVYVYVRHHQLTGVWSFALADWHGLALAPQEQVWLFWCFVIAFAVKIPLVPLHTWLPDAYSEAPTPAVFLLSGVMAKLGAYGLIRFALPLFPLASAAGLPVLRILAVVGIVYGALIALVQTDLKRLIAYSSISHLGFVVLGIASGDVQGLQGALFQMVSHALSTGSLFLLAGMLEERTGTTRIADFGGLAAGIPWFAASLLLAIFSSAGLPGLNGFVGELLIILGAFHANPVLAGIAATGMVWGACYLLWFYQRAMFGPVPDASPELPPPGDGQPPPPLPDLSWREGIMLMPVAALMVLLGIFPQPMLDRSAVVAQRWVRIVAAPPLVAPQRARRNP